MIKFFRRIRYDLMEKNKTGKYIKYAIGEIILVVIGILIALYINNVAEQKKTEEKVDLVFEELMEELASNIATIKRKGVFYKHKDSLTHLVLNTNLSKEHYKTYANDFLSITHRSSSIGLSHNAYDKLVQMSEFIPIKYKGLMEELHRLNKLKLYVDYMDVQFRRLITEIIDYEVYNYSWPINNDKDELVNYFYSDPRYKANVIRISSRGNNEQYEHAILYFEQAIKHYKDLAALLQKPIDYNLIGYASPLMDELIGDYVSEQVPGAVVTIYEEDNQLYGKINIEPEIGKFYFLTDSKIIVTPSRVFISVIEKDGKTAMHNSSNGILFEKKEGDK